MRSFSGRVPVCAAKSFFRSPTVSSVGRMGEVCGDTQRMGHSIMRTGEAAVSGVQAPAHGLVSTWVALDSDLFAEPVIAYHLDHAHARPLSGLQAARAPDGGCVHAAPRGRGRDGAHEHSSPP